jgi:hypothetical protein
VVTGFGNAEAVVQSGLDCCSFPLPLHRGSLKFEFRILSPGLRA